MNKTVEQRRSLRVSWIDQRDAQESVRPTQENLGIIIVHIAVERPLHQDGPVDACGGHVFEQNLSREIGAFKRRGQQSERLALANLYHAVRQRPHAAGAGKSVKAPKDVDVRIDDHP